MEWTKIEELFRKNYAPAVFFFQVFQIFNIIFWKNNVIIQNQTH